MHHRKLLGLALSAAALIGAAATSQATILPASVILDFDGLGTTAGDFTPSFATMAYGQFVPTLDGFGDPIPGSDHWEIDPSGGLVPVSNPSLSGWGPAPSPSKALDARDGPVLIVFAAAYDITSFSATLDNSTFGDLNPANTGILFYDQNDVLLFTAAADQTIAGFTVNVGSLSNVKTVVLPPSAFYDNITVVPEPGAALSFVTGAGLLLGLRRRRF